MGKNVLLFASLILSILTSGCGKGLNFIQDQETISPPSGTLVTSFGTSGKTLLLVPGTTAINIYDGRLQSDGKFVVTGSANIGGLLNWLVARINTDGTLDTTFNGTGYWTHGDLSADAELSGIDIQSDGKIVACGWWTSTYNEGVVRLNSDGTPDTTFGTSGIFTYGTNGLGYTAKVLSSGKILIGGTTLRSGVWQFSLLQLNSNGTVNSSFGTSGIVFPLTPGENGYVTAIAIQNDGKILLGGESSSDNTHYDQMAIARLNANGSTDTTFNSTGSREISISPGSDGALSGLAVQSDGKIVASAHGSDGGPHQIGLLFRLNTNGTSDAGFGTAGKVLSDSGYDEQFGKLSVLSNGNIVVPGYVTDSGGHSSASIKSYTSTGLVNSSFGTDGAVTLDFGTGDSSFLALSVRSDGKILIAGEGISTSGGIASALLWP